MSQIKKKILFRADGNSIIGLGHLYRLFAIVEMVKDAYDFHFITKENSTLTVIPNDYNLVTIPIDIDTNHEPEWLKKWCNPEEHLLFCDGYQFNSNYQKSIIEKGFKLIYVDDLVSEKMHANLVINHSPFIYAHQYLSESYTKFALGLDFAILRPKFLAATETKRKISEIHNAFVCFGGADPSNLTLQITNELLKHPAIENIMVVLGGAYVQKEIFELAKKYPKIQLHQNLNEEEMINLMYTCQLAIVPSSTILYELCAIQLQIISGYFVENQYNIYKGFLNSDVIHGIGDFNHLKINELSEMIENVMKTSHLSNQIEKQQNLFKPGIKKRFIDLILNL